LFGIERFVSGGKRVIICEGEIDALSLAEASYKRYGKFYPIVALSSSAMAHKSILANRDWVKSFKEVVLCFDEDDAGNKAKNEAIKIVGADKVRLTKLPENDASDVIKLHGNDALMQCVFDAEKYVPSGIITKEKLWERLVVYNNTESIPYPECISGINTKLKGMRFGEITLFTSGTSCGKSTMLREIILHIIENTTDSVGVVSLEESPEETARKLAGMVLMKNPAKEELTLEELKPAFDRVFENDRIVLLDHQGGMKDDSILDKLEYMALSGCKYIFIDHITILVSEGADGLTGNEAIDKVMNDLLKFVKRFPVWVGLVSHLRKTSNTGKAFEEGKMPTLDDIKGSGSIKQISMDIVAFARNLMAEDPVVRNTIEIASLKCRFTGLTGFVSGSYYDFDTGRLKHVSEAPQLFTKIG
jgi:twinkle protein